MIETEEEITEEPTEEVEVTEDYHILKMWCYCKIDENNKHIMTTVVDYVKNQKHYKKTFENMLEEDK